MTAADRGSLLRNGDFMRLWLGQSVSVVGDFMFDTTVMLWIGAVLAKGQPWGPAAVGGVLIAQGAPALLIGPFAGVFADRWDKRRTMLLMNVISTVAVLLLWWAIAFDHGMAPAAQLTLCYAIVALVSACEQFFIPARVTLISDVVTEDERGTASSLGQASFSVAMIAGPPIAAPVLFAFGVGWALLINAASFAVSFAMILLVRARHGEDRRQAKSWRAEFMVGLRFFASCRPLVVTAAALVLTMFGSGAVNSLALYYVTDNLHVSADRLGTVMMGLGIGAVVGSLACVVLIRRLGIARIFWSALLLNAVALLALSRTGTLAIALVEAGVLGMAMAMESAALSPLVLKLTPRAMVGRVLAVFGPVLELASLASAGVAGVLVSTVLRGLDGSVLGLLIACSGVVAAAGLRDPRLD